MYRLINVVAVITAAVLGAILGGEYENPLHLLGLCTIIAYAVVVDNLIREHEKKNADLESKEKDIDSKNVQLAETKQQLSDTSLKLSQILLQSNQSGENRMYLAVFPSTSGIISCSSPIEIHVVLNTPYDIQPAPDIKLITKERWKSIKADGNIVLPSRYANQFEYTVSSSRTRSLQNHLNKYFVYKLEIEFHKAGVFEFIIEAKSHDFISTISNNIEVA
ncbi:hypothetical protein BBD41_12425 [Paenibacillus ihbetae]|uniref:Uncharacterized protein n=1 Tax=Paenibacillus ihbetae TaxID=1870820 RepID=A0A1B2E060_9BACL|nr:hypothetical protein [Paenibacillus ihbetae]ANY73321.1 hypothetical protein BBD41_12425 [Paenibacillus ihbetae]